MKSSKPHIREAKSTDISIADFARTKLPRLQKPQKRPKKPSSKLSARLDSTPQKSERPSENLQNLCAFNPKKYLNLPKQEILKRIKTSLPSSQPPSITPNLQDPLKCSLISQSDNNPNPLTSTLTKYSKRLFFNRRPEMSNKNLLVIHFEGVLGSFIKENLWEDTEEILCLRKGAIKGLKIMLKEFQVALFFMNSEGQAEKVMKYFEDKGLRIDAVYGSENFNRWKSKSVKVKRPLKYSEYVQNYTQVAIDFGVQYEVLSKMLVLTSVFLEQHSFFLPGHELIVKNAHTIPMYLWYSLFSRGVPVLDNPDTLLPITFGVGDPKLENSGCDLIEIALIISHLSNFSAESDQCSWIDGFAQYREITQKSCLAFESSLYQLGLTQQRLKIQKSEILQSHSTPIEKCFCPNDMKKICKSIQYGTCTCFKKMSAYHKTGKKIPNCLLKNKFIIHRSLTGFPYKPKNL